MTDHTSDSVGNKMEETLDVIRQVNEQLKDAVSNFDIVLKNMLTYLVYIYSYFFCSSVGSDYFCVRLYTRILIVV